MLWFPKPQFYFREWIGIKSNKEYDRPSLEEAHL